MTCQSDHMLKVPWRSHIYDMSNGNKQIHISLNGRLALALECDPRTGTLTELRLPTPHDVETKSKDETHPYMKHG